MQMNEIALQSESIIPGYKTELRIMMSQSELLYIISSKFHFFFFELVT